MTQSNSEYIGNRMLGRLTQTVITGVCVVFFSAGLMAQESAVTTTSVETSSTASEEGEVKITSAKTKQQKVSGYDVKASFEIGGRGKKIEGSENKYRSDLNYDNGFRLFDSSILVTAKESQGKPFDSLLVTGSGWSADPNGYTRINMEKMGLYRFDSSIRRITYFNSLTNFALNEHNRNTRRDMADFDLTILPQNENFKFRVGYSFNSVNGPASTTYDFDRDEFPILSEYDSTANDLRFGFDAKLLGFNLSFTEGIRRYVDNTNFRIDSPQLGANPNPRSSFDSFSRIIPERGSVNYHSLSIHRTFDDKLDFTGRIIYSDSTSRFGMTERLTGIDRFGNIVVLNESVIEGNSKRPNTVGDIGITLFATDKFSISNSFSANSYRISGGNILAGRVISTTAGGTPLPTTSSDESVYRFTSFRRYINTIEAAFDANRYLSFYAGYRYTNRRVMLEGLDIDLSDQSASGSAETAENTTNAFIGGFKASPILKKWTIFFDAEHGEADNSFTRLGNKAMTNFRIRNRIKPTNNLSVFLSFQSKDNNTPGRPGINIPSDFVADVNSQNVSASIDWTVNDNASLSGGFTHHRLTSETSVIFPITGGSGQGLSRYNLRSNFGHIDAWLRPHNRVSLFGSYRVTRDTGDGDFFSAADYLIEGNYPISFQSPEARLTMKINRNIDFNLGYQYYKFEEKILNSQNYSAHLPYASLRFYFGGTDR